LDLADAAGGRAMVGAEQRDPVTSTVSFSGHAPEQPSVVKAWSSVKAKFPEELDHEK
jgi:hypothetical protein